MVERDSRPNGFLFITGLVTWFERRTAEMKYISSSKSKDYSRVPRGLNKDFT